jgi:ribonucleotide reductase alpha subunit
MMFLQIADLTVGNFTVTHYMHDMTRCYRYVDQGGGKRPGAFAIYIEPWHADIFEVPSVT